MEILKIVMLAMIACLLVWGGLLAWMMKRMDQFEDKIEMCEKITQNEYEMYMKMKEITQHYQRMIQEDDLK